MRRFLLAGALLLFGAAPALAQDGAHIHPAVDLALSQTNQRIDLNDTELLNVNQVLVALQLQIDSLFAAGAVAHTALQFQIDAQGVVDSGLQSQVDAQGVVDSGLQSQIDAQGVVDSGLQSQIDAQDVVDSGLQSQIDAQGVADSGLQSQIDALDARVALLEAGSPPPPPPPPAGDTVVVTSMDSVTVFYTASWQDYGDPDYIIRLRWASDGSRCDIVDCVPEHPVNGIVGLSLDGIVNRGSVDRTVDVFLVHSGTTSSGVLIGTVFVPLDPNSGGGGGGGGGGGSLKQVAIDLTTSAGPGANEPPGFTQLDPTVVGNWDILHDYGAHQECSPVDSRCFFNPAQGTAAFGHGPVLHHTWPTGFGDDSLWPGTRGRSGGTRLNFLDTSLQMQQGYISVKFEMSPNIQIGPTGLKIVGIKKPKWGGGGSAQMAWILATGMNGGRLTLDQKIASGDFQTPESPRGVSSSLVFTSGVVYHLEVYVKINSAAGVPDGIATVWVNGVQYIHVTDVVWYADEIGEAAKAKWVVGALIDPIPSARVPAPENWIKYDDFYVSLKP